MDKSCSGIPRFQMQSGLGAKILVTDEVDLEVRLRLYNNLMELAKLTEKRLEEYNQRKGYMCVADMIVEPKHKQMWELVLGLRELWKEVILLKGYIREEAQ